MALPAQLSPEQFGDQVPRAQQSQQHPQQQAGLDDLGLRQHSVQRLRIDLGYDAG